MRLCACGCGRPLKRNAKPAARFASIQCVPMALRVAGGRKGGHTQAMRLALVRFREELRRLEDCKPMTREDVLTAFAAVYQKGYHAGQFTRRRRVSGAAA